VALLKRAGRKRGIEAEAARLRVVLRAGYLHQPQLVEDAYGRQTLALLRLLDAACANADELEMAAATSFALHPDAAIITSLPGLAALTGARILAEIGDDRSRFADARSLKAYSCAAPVTWQEPLRDDPQGQEPASGRGRIPLGLLRASRGSRTS
jgi:transposase